MWGSTPPGPGVVEFVPAASRCGWRVAAAGGGHLSSMGGPRPSCQAYSFENLIDWLSTLNMFTLANDCALGTYDEKIVIRSDNRNHIK